MLSDHHQNIFGDHFVSINFFLLLDHFLLFSLQNFILLPLIVQDCTDPLFYPGLPIVLKLRHCLLSHVLSHDPFCNCYIMLFSQCRGSCETYVTCTGISKLLTSDDLPLCFQVSQSCSPVVIDEMLLCQHVFKVFFDFL
jgi:hypothetical protein